MDHLTRASWTTPAEHLRHRLAQAKADAAETQYIYPILKTWQQAARSRIKNNGSRYGTCQHWTWTRKNGQRWIGFHVRTAHDKQRRTTSATNWPDYIMDIVYADEFSHTKHIGWFRDSFQDATYRGCSVYIRGAGWLPGYLDTESEVIQCDLSEIGNFPEYGDPDWESDDDRCEAARRGDRLAEIDAERDREWDELDQAARRLADELDDHEAAAQEAIEEAAALIPARNVGEPCTRRVIRATLRRLIARYRELIEEIDDLKGKFEEAADDYARHTGKSFSR
jgi:hypothetical protein